MNVQALGGAEILTDAILRRAGEVKAHHEWEGESGVRISEVDGDRFLIWYVPARDKVLVARVADLEEPERAERLASFAAWVSARWNR